MDLLILDEWLIRPLTSQKSYDLLEIAESRSSRSTIFCAQYQPEGWYTRIDPDPESQSPEQSWTELFIIRMRSWLKDVSRCANARDFEQLL